jgi:hypothetical protein
MKRIVLTWLVLVLAAVPVWSQPRGYQSRASGFDQSFGGRLCDGQGDSASTTGEDVDGNGVADRQVYVDLTSGTNNSSCGLPGSPCRTNTYAQAGSNGGVAGGPIGNPATNQIQAICFRGTGRETVTLSRSGAAGFYERPATGSQARAFRYPRYPFILSGWDSNNNGSYPPHDPADVAVLDGSAGGSSLPWAILNSGQQRFELAHFTARNYGLTCGNEGGFMKVVGGIPSPEYLYLHDVVIEDVIAGCPNGPGLIVFWLYPDGSLARYLAMENITANRVGSWVIRGAGAEIEFGPYRFQNFSVTVRGASGDLTSLLKLWSYLTGIEVLDSIFNANPTAWSPNIGSPPTVGLGLDACTRDWTVRNNELIDFKISVILTSFNEACGSRTLDNVRIDRNIIRNTYAPWQFLDLGIWIWAGGGTSGHVEKIWITNNFLSSSAGWEACILSEATGTSSGTVTIAGNTCYGAINRHAGIVIGNPTGGQSPSGLQNYVIRNNIIAGTQGGLNIATYYNLTGLASDGNAYDPQGSFLRSGASQTLAQWRSAFGGDQSSKQCAPAFVGASSGNFRLSPTDSCARGAGVGMASITSWDIDGSPRSGTAPSIGAHEFGGTAVGAPSAPTNLRIIR